jgi:hypothetical protein
MSEQDYNAGKRGEDWSPAMDRQSYDAGRSVYNSKQAILNFGNGPKTEIDGPGFVGIVMAPILAMMYPVAGFTTVAAMLATQWVLDFLPPSLNVLKVLAAIAAFFFWFSVALKAEAAVSNLKIYRVSRHALRLVLVGGVTFGAIIGTSRYRDFHTAFNHASGSALFWGLVSVGLMHWLFPKFDRLFFPVMDDKAKAEAKANEGLSEEEIREKKYLRFVNFFRFWGAWLFATIALSSIFHHGIPVVLLGVAAFFICRKLRGYIEKQPSAAVKKSAAAEVPAPEKTPAGV